MGFKSRKTPSAGKARKSVRATRKGWDSLSDREKKAATLIMQAKLSREEMAEKMGCGPKTFDSHRLAAMNALGTSLSTQLVHFGIREGVIKTPKAKKKPGKAWESLSDRQKEAALHFMAAKKNRAQIAAAMKLNSKTLDSHRLALLAKLDLTLNTQLVHFGLREGLITIPTK